MAEKIETDPAETVSDESENENADVKFSERRVPRSIRFSDSEWKLIEEEARERGMAASELVRHVSVGFVTGKFTTAPSGNFQSVFPIMADQIERIYNGVYLIATLKRDEMLREGRQDELDKIVERAQKSRKLFHNSIST